MLVDDAPPISLHSGYHFLLYTIFPINKVFFKKIHTFTKLYTPIL